LRGKQLLPSLLPEVDQYLNIQRNNNGYHHSFSSFKLLELYELLIKYEPKTILELGGGASTAVFVKYAKEMHKKNVKVNIVSVDESEKYINITKSNIESIFFI